MPALPKLVSRIGDLRTAIESGQRRDLSTRDRLIALVGCFSVIVARAPQLVLNPRLYAEEASVYLSYAFSNDLLRTILLIPTSDGPAGYLHLVANFSAILSTRVFPLEWAPFVGTYLALTCQLLPLILVLWGRSKLWGSPARRYVLCVLLLVATPIRTDVWLQVINAQIFLGLSSLLILFEDLDRAGTKRVRCYRGLLTLGAMTGAYTVLLAPVFWLRARVTRGREASTQFRIVGIIALLQASSFLGNRLTKGDFSGRFGNFSFADVTTVAFLDHLVQPILSGALIPYLRDVSPALGLLSLGLILALIAGLALLAKRSAEPLVRLLPFTLLFVMTATSILALGAPTHRYAVFPGMIFLITLLALCWSRDLSAIGRGFCSSLIIVSLLSGAATYWQDPPMRNSYGELFSFLKIRDGAPVWEEEVQQWRLDSHRLLRVWPYGESVAWTASLSSRFEFQEIRAQLALTDGFTLVAEPGQTQSLEIAVDRLPPDFRLAIRGTNDLQYPTQKLTLILLDAHRQPILEQSVPLATDNARFRAHWTLGLLRSRTENSEISSTRYILFEAKAKPNQRSQLGIEGISIAPRVEGLLDQLLPSSDLPQKLYTASARSPLAQEATAMLALQSLARDNDLLYQDEDQQRGSDLWVQGAHPIQLSKSRSSTDSQRSRFQEALPFLLLAYPGFQALGTDGVVLLNLLLFSILAIGVIAFRWNQGPTDRIFSLTSVLLAVGSGFVFLPQSTVLEMFCLFVPVAAWLHGRWDRSGNSELLLYGSLLGVAILHNPLWLAIPLAIAFDNWKRRENLKISRVACGAAAITLIAFLIPIPGRIVWSLPPLSPPDWKELFNFYVARTGLFLGYPLALFALFEVLHRGTVSRRWTLAGLLVLLTSVAPFLDSTSNGAICGSPLLAVLYPLYSLLPTRIVSRWFLIAPLLLGVLVTLGTISGVWTP